MHLLRSAFTMLELLFVIVVMGIIGVIGAEIFRNTYDAYTSSTVNSRMHVETELALQQLANRLQYRFKDSIIARSDQTTNGYFDGLSYFDPDKNATIIEWVGYDSDGWHGDWNITLNTNTPTWSGFIDLDAPADLNNDGYPDNPAILFTPGTNTARISQIISNLSPRGADINQSAIFFVGANTDPKLSYDWNSSMPHMFQFTAAHRIRSTPVNGGRFLADANETFQGIDVYEQYKLAWTAYGIKLDDNDTDGKTDELMFFYDYRPWENNETYYNGRASLLIDNVTTFKMQAIGDILKIQICVDNNASGTIPTSQYYSLCKEKVVF
jgi:prepilin-type N-terminal cleavage/methylation domain-containing protein